MQKDKIRLPKRQAYFFFFAFVACLIAQLCLFIHDGNEWRLAGILFCTFCVCKHTPDALYWWRNRK